MPLSWSEIRDRAVAFSGENFPWLVELLFSDEKEPLPGIKSARSAIESGAQAVLDARA